MTSFIFRRLLSGVLTLVTISVFGFVLLYSGAHDIARRLVGNTAAPEIVARKEAELGLDRPLIEQFVEWATGAISGDLGRSWFSGQYVVDALAARLPVTLSLTLGATVLTLIAGIMIGVIAASKRGVADRVTQVISFVVSAVPGFLIALFLVYLFGLTLHWLPATGYIPIEKSFTGWLSTITLPIVALALGATASVAQQVRGAMIDTLRLDYVRTLRSRGLPYNRVVYRHVLRNAAGPALSILGLQIIVMFGGAVVIEQVFSAPGVGQAAVAATIQGDVPLVMGIIVATGLFVLIINLVIDLIQGLLNPKVRVS
ncbi:ABC transporter permease [Glutamicibacter sp. NPDC087344]|uniref:ABC transporter permease n=1 Tax=Glutamicibacter sp. NPDC087344 TaxID=3363994 RepID=UPI00380960BB